VQSKNFLRNHVSRALLEYFDSLEETVPTGLYNLVLAEVEAPLLETVMQKTKGNQSQAATMLGLNRGTLRKLLIKYGLG
jgi:Fis family transcriptional regulator